MQCQVLLARPLSACLASPIPRVVARRKMWVLACLRDVDSADAALVILVPVTGLHTAPREVKGGSG